MLTEEAIRQALHASRIVSLAVTNPHGPLGLEQVAAAVAALRADFLLNREGWSGLHPSEARRQNRSRI